MSERIIGNISEAGKPIVGYINNAVLKGDPGKDGITPHIGENGNWFVGSTDTNIKAIGRDGAQGEKGEDGKSMVANKFYASIPAMQADFYNAVFGDVAIIQSPEGAANEDNAKLYFRDNSEWVFICDLSGFKGEKGDKPAHRWDGTRLSLENPDGSFDAGVDLKGAPGAGDVTQEDLSNAINAIEITFDII